MEHYVHGEWNAICDRCGFEFKSGQLQLEHWTGWRVCSRCLDKRNPQEFAYPKPGEKPIPWSRPDIEAPFTMTNRNYISLSGAAGNFGGSSRISPIPGNFTIRALVSMNDWTPATFSVIAGKYHTNINQRAFRLSVRQATNTLVLQATENGEGLGNFLSADSSVPPTVSDGSPLWIKVTADIDAGGGTSLVTFYTSNETTLARANDVTWTQLGIPVASLSITGVYTSEALFEVGSSNSGSAQNFGGKIYYVDVLDGIGDSGSILMKFNAEEFPLNALGGVGLDGAGWAFGGASRVLNT